MSLKRKIFNFFLATSVVAAGITAPASAVNINGGKAVEENGDLTYTVTVGGTNDLKANVVMLLDTSCYYPLFSTTCVADVNDDARNAVKTLASNLLSLNETASDALEMAVIAFDSEVRTTTGPTTALGEIESAIDNAENHLGLNWSAGLDAANAVFNDGDPTYVILVSGGTPTNPLFRAIAAAQESAGQIENLLTMGVYTTLGAGSYRNINSLGGAQFNGESAEEISANVDTITSEIENALTMTDVTIRDTLSEDVELVQNSFIYHKGTGADYETLEEWTEAPAEAEYSQKSVTWESGAELKPGESVAVSFKVYPTDETLTQIADNFNDGAEISAEYLSKEGESYYLSTNVDDSATLEYALASQKQVEGVPVVLDNPDPVEIKPTLVTIEKAWNDSLDPSVKEEIESVTLDLTKDGQTAKSFEVSAGDEWKYGEYAVVPEIVLNGETLEMAPGHEYTLSEAETDERFESEAVSFQPVMEDGELKNGLTDEALGEAVAVTNTLKGEIVISKVVSINTVDHESDEALEEKIKNQKFTLSVSFSKADGTNYQCQYVVVDKDGNEGAEKSCSEHGDLQEDVTIDDKILVKYVDSGVTYSVRETANGLPTGFYATEDMSEGEPRVDYYISEGDSEELAEDANHAAQANSRAKAEVLNYYLAGDLKISKEIVVRSGNVEQATSKTFKFDVEIKDSEGRIIGQYTQELGNGDSYLIKNVPAGASYTVSESEKPGYRAITVNNAEGTIPVAEEISAEFTNEYSVRPETRTLSATKMFGTLDDKWIDGDAFEFALFESVGRRGIKRQVKTVDALTRTANFDIRIRDEGEWYYSIREDNEDEWRGGVYRADNEPVRYKVSATDNGRGRLDITVELVSDDDTIFNDYYAEPLVLGDDEEEEYLLTVYKTLEGEVEGKEISEEFEFTISLLECYVESAEECGFVFEPQTISITGAGEGMFSNIIFEEPGLYIFNISEVAGNNAEFSYDANSYEMFVVVYDDLEGHLMIGDAGIFHETGDEEEPFEFVEEMVFSNTYTPIVVPKTPDTGALAQLIAKKAGAKTSYDGQVMIMILGVSAIAILAGVSVVMINKIKA